MGIERLLLRMAYWARRPPSRSKLMVMLVVVLCAAALVLIEHTVGWPHWLTVNTLRR